VVIAPWTTFAYRIARRTGDAVDLIVVRAASSSHTAIAEAEVRGVLSANRRPGIADHGFSILNVNETYKPSFFGFR